MPGVRTNLRSCLAASALVLQPLARALLALIISGFTAGILAATAQAAPDAVPGELIVRFERGVDARESRAIVDRSDASITTRLPGKTAVVKIEDGTSSAQATRELQAQDGVVYAEPNYVVRRQAWTNDPFLTDGSLWGLYRVKAPTAWNVSRGGGVIVAVLDSGIAPDHPDLVNSLWQNPDELDDGIDNDHNGFADDSFGADWVRRDGMPDDEAGHGTHVAGTIAATADDGNPAVGVVPDAKLMSLKFLDGEGAGNVGDAISAIDYAIEKGASVINASWGGPDYSAALEDAIARAGDAGIVFVTAAGNDGSDNDDMPIYPAALNLPNVVSVAAMEQSGRLADFSNYGPNTVDVAAPGVDVYSTVGDGYEAWSGTSMASPFVAGVAALLKSAAPGIGAAQTADAILAGARDLQTLSGKVSSGGYTDAVGALAAIGRSPLDAADVPPGAFKLRRPGKKVYGGRKIKFSWSRAADTDLIGYEVYLDGRLQAVVEDPDGSQGPRAAKTSVKLKVKTGKHRWHVIAVDEAGNERKAGRGKSKGRVAVLSRKRR